jgi:hypothetical protein
MAHVVIWGIMPVRVRGARNQLQLNKGHYIGWWCSSSRNSYILVVFVATCLWWPLACGGHLLVKYVIVSGEIGVTSEQF